MSEPFGCLKTGLATPIRMFDDVFDVFIVSSHEAPIAFDDLITIIGHTFFPQDALLYVWMARITLGVGDRPVW